MLNKSNPFKYMANGSKNPKQWFLLHCGPAAWVTILTYGVKYTLLKQYFLTCFYLFDSIFSVWIDKLHDFDGGVSSEIISAMETRKINSNGCGKKNYFIKNMNLLYKNYIWKIWVDWRSARL